MRLTDAVLLGAADFAHRTPGAHEPTGDVLDPFVVAYWDGWTAAVMDGATATIRNHATGFGAIIGATEAERRSRDCSPHRPTGHGASSA